MTGDDTIQEGEAYQIEITERQRRRLDEIKAECTGEGLGQLPEPTDQMVLKGLLDTWDAVDEGHYSEGRLMTAENGERDALMSTKSALLILTFGVLMIALVTLGVIP